MSGIALERVTKVYPDGTAAVVDMDLRIHDGEFFVLVGPSGCGKSTVLRLVAGLEESTRGTIRIGDEVVDGLRPAARDIAMVFETAALYPHMDVEDNLGIALSFRGASAAERADPVRRTAGRLGLGDLLRRRPRELAAGERQRVGLGRAMVRQPRAFLMDEPLSALDAALRVKMRASIARLHRELGVHHALRHPRPARGDGVGRPGRGDAGRARWSRSTSRACSTTAPRRCSWPPSSGRRR